MQSKIMSQLMQTLGTRVRAAPHAAPLLAFQRQSRCGYIFRCVGLLVVWLGSSLPNKWARIAT